MKKSLPQLKRVKNYPPSKILCSAYSAKYIPPNYLKKTNLKEMGSKETTSMFQQGRGMNWTVKKTTLIISKNRKKNLLKTILFCQHIKSSLNKKDKKQKKTYHHYTCTELHTCFETFVMIINLHSVLQFSNYYTYLLLLY